ncbi:hypothetical protein ACEXQE_06840 [Herbiconiux sp. P17]|uniref:hypothetical protein n=1 Tax=Herbiconiux wuyangfengii TaxID=3342794 RepID=UPI0035B93096
MSAVGGEERMVPETTDAAPAAAPAPPKSRDSAARLLVGPAIVVVVVLGLATLSMYSIGLFVVGYVGFALAVLAVPYTVVALVIAVVGHLRIRPSAPAPGTGEAAEREVQNFERFSQRVSLVLAVALLLVLVVAGTLFLTTAGRDFASSPIMVLGGTVVVGAVFTIAANIPQLYRRRVIALEKHAVATRTGAWRLILVSWIASPVMWIAYSVVVLLSFTPLLRG